jgi:hypothetical protein
VDLPSFVTHYHLADRRPFLNLCDLPDDELDAVLADLGRLRRTGRHHRPFGRRYMEMRRATETRLRSAFVAAGGRPARRSPHYFVLGESAWYARLGERMGEVRIPLTALPAEQTSWTCSDSFVTMEAVAADDRSADDHHHRGRVFLLDELDAVLADIGVPSPAWADEHRDWRTWPRRAFVEVQLWSDEPVRAYLG